jgi:hypothetical protein
VSSAGVSSLLLRLAKISSVGRMTRCHLVSFTDVVIHGVETADGSDTSSMRAPCAILLDDLLSCRCFCWSWCCFPRTKGLNTPWQDQDRMRCFVMAEMSASLTALCRIGQVEPVQAWLAEHTQWNPLQIRNMVIGWAYYARTPNSRACNAAWTYSAS